MLVHHDPTRVGGEVAGTAAGRAPARFAPGEPGALSERRRTPPEAGNRMRCSTTCSCQNQRIAACESTRELCSVIEEHATEVNNVNVSTAFRKLLQAPRALA